MQIKMAMIRIRGLGLRSGGRDIVHFDPLLFRAGVFDDHLPAFLHPHFCPDQSGENADPASRHSGL